MRLYNAVCAWLEAHAEQMGREEAPSEPQPEGNNFTQAEHAHTYTTQPEMHLANRGTSIDDDDSGSHKHRRIGFARNP